MKTLACVWLFVTATLYSSLMLLAFTVAITVGRLILLAKKEPLAQRTFDGIIFTFNRPLIWLNKTSGWALKAIHRPTFGPIY